MTEILGHDANGEPVRVGDFVALDILANEVLGAERMRSVAGYGAHNGSPYAFQLAEMMDCGWTRARARQLGFPAPSGGSVGAATREDAGAAPSGSVQDLPTQPSEGCLDPCYICGQSDPIVARLENEPICEHCYTHCHECSAALIAGRDATVLTERLCDYCDRRAANVLAGREPRVDLPVPAEPYEDGDVYELPNAEWP